MSFLWKSSRPGVFSTRKALTTRTKGVHMATRDLTAARLRELLNYDPETGLLTWIRSGQGVAYPGKVAGRFRPDGYVNIGIDKQLHQAHRLAWLYMTGEHPKHCIDHIDGNPANNRWANLRDVTHSVNHQNRRPGGNNTTGYLGITRSGKKWSAKIVTNGKITYLGAHATPEEAHAAYMAAKRIQHEACPPIERTISKPVVAPLSSDKESQNG